MANVAPYEVTVTGTDDETFAFVIPFANEDGTAFPFATYAIEYAVAGYMSLAEGAGITVTAPNVTFKAAAGTLKPGIYSHGCRLRHLTTGEYIQVFDGTVTIAEGNF